MGALSIWHIIVLLIILPVTLALCFLPSIIAFRRNHHNRIAILALNVLLGWTGLGWIAALVWSLTAVEPQRT